MHYQGRLFFKSSQNNEEGLTSTVFWHLINTLLMGIAVAIFALHALFDDSLQKLPAELAHSRAHVAMQNKRVRDSNTSSCFLVCSASTQRRGTALFWYNIAGKKLQVEK
jgi:hypothetical protein